MSQSVEWQFRLWPLDFGIGIRAIQLSEAFQEHDLAPHDPAAARALPRADPRSVGRIRMLDDNVLDWESEGGKVD